MMQKIRLFLYCFLLALSGNSQQDSQQCIPGANRTDSYLPLLKNRSVAIFANQTSMIGNTHLVDSLLKLAVRVKKIFAPEHGFRGKADAGEQVGNQTDPVTGIPIISLYGTKQGPSIEDLKDIDIMIFDIQDVGVRFYTYISSLQKFIEAAILNNKPLIILDRPNPNGFYVDGPVLKPGFESFVGMQPVPIVYGMTIGEYAEMLVGERWLTAKADSLLNAKFGVNAQAVNPSHYNAFTNKQLKQADLNGFILVLVPCSQYDHNSHYRLPVKPSPNLPDMQSVYLYPSLCLFEGTRISLGRGTSKPFQQFGHPSFKSVSYHFTPTSVEGAVNPPLKDQVCYGFDLSGYDLLQPGNNKIHLEWLLNAYQLFPDKDNFFLSSGFFNKLAGNDLLMSQIKQAVSAKDIRASWQKDLESFKKIRKKYLIYKDIQ